MTSLYGTDDSTMSDAMGSQRNKEKRVGYKEMNYKANNSDAIPCLHSLLWSGYLLRGQSAQQAGDGQWFRQTFQENNE